MKNKIKEIINYKLYIIIFNLLIALSFYYSNKDASVFQLSSDHANIIPICQKYDNYQLFKNDDYLSDFNDFKYYTPTFIHSLRFLSTFTEGNYVQAVNLLGFFLHFLYGVIWFAFFFSISRNFFISFLYSIFVRGIVWLPGYEFLGISDIFTILPRTFFTTFIPIPFIIYFLSNKKSFFFPALTLGLIANFHIISGLSFLIISLSSVIYINYQQNEKLKKIITNLLIIQFTFFIGIIPFLVNYIGAEKSLVTQPLLLDYAIKDRFHEMFFDSILFLKKWNKSTTYFYLITFVIYLFFDTSFKKLNSKIILFNVLILLMISNLSIPIENFINEFYGKYISISFQLVRMQKYVIVLFQIAQFLLIIELIKFINLSLKIIIITFLVFFLVLFSSNRKSIIPFFGDDIICSILPKKIKFFDNSTNVDIEKKKSLLSIYNYIKKSTKETDVFYSTDIYTRMSTLKSVKLDNHAASMLIDSNPGKYLDFYILKSSFEKLKNDKDRINFLKKLSINYIIDDHSWKEATLIFSSKHYNLYKIK